MSYRVDITAQAPISIGAHPQAGNHTRSLRYLPGTTLRGALAQRWIAEHGTPQQAASGDRAAFVKLFESAVRYGPAHGVDSSIARISELRLKYGDESEERPALIDVAFDPEPANRIGYDTGRGEIAGVDMVSTTRTRLEEDRAMAADGNLFTRDAIAPGSQFAGRITGSHPWLDQLCDQDLRVRFGARRSTAGAATLRLTRLDPLAAAGGDGQHTLVLESPAILLDTFGRTAIRAEPAHIADTLGITAAAVTIDAQWVRHVSVHGWHAASGLPKPDDLGLAVGSVIQFRIEGDVDIEPLIEWGIGLRRAEGFGACRLVHGRRPLALPNAAAAADSYHAVTLFAGAKDARWHGLSAKQLRDFVKDCPKDASEVEKRIGQTAFADLTNAQQETLIGFVNQPDEVLEDLGYLLEEHRLPSLGGAS